MDIDLNNIIEQTAATAPEKKGTKSAGLTQYHSRERGKIRRNNNREVWTAPNSPETVERVSGEIVNTDNINEFKEFFQEQCEYTLEQFKQKNPDLVKKHVYNWHKQLLIELKHNTPPVGAGDLDKLIIVWDCLKELLYKIGLYPTFELFSIFTGVYKYQLENMHGLSPKYVAFRQKITADVNNGLINDLHSNPYNQTNKIFLAKTRGIIEQTAPKTVEVVHQIQKYNDISAYRIEKRDNATDNATD